MLPPPIECDGKSYLSLPRFRIAIQPLRRSRPMSKMKTILAGASVAIAMAAAANAEAAVVVHLTPTYPGTVSGSVPYSLSEVLQFTFTINPPYHFTFTATGEGGTFP